MLKYVFIYIYVYVMKRNRGMFQIYDETESPHETGCVRYMMDRNRHRKPPKSFLPHSTK